MYCDHCGKEIKHDAKFCPFCGENVKDEATIESRKATKPIVQGKDSETVQSKVPSWMLPVCIAVAIAIILCVLFSMGAFDSGIENNRTNSQKGDDLVESRDSAEEESDGNSLRQTNDSQDEQSANTVEYPAFPEVYASSSRETMGDINYEPFLAIDGDWSTAWCEGGIGAGEGEWIELNAEHSQRINGVRILNGYFKSKELYDNNNTVATALITTDMGDYMWDLPHSYNGFQEYTFPSPVDTVQLRITIETANANGDGLDTLISEIEVF